MVFDHISRLKSYAAIIPEANEIAEFLNERKFDAMGHGEWKIVSPRCRVVFLNTFSSGIDIMESHRYHFDLHVTLTGVDVMNWANCENLIIHKTYDEAKDFTLWQARTEFTLPILINYFLLLTPNEAHSNHFLENDTTKCVFKIKVSP